MGEDWENLVETAKGKKKDKGKETLLKIGFGLGFGLFICSILIYLYYLKKEDRVEITSVIGTNAEVINDTKEILIDISGAVGSGGIYEMKEGQRRADLVEKAGGFLANVDKEWLQKNFNLAGKLEDGEKIYIPYEGENYKEENSIKNTGGKININTASSEELIDLTGVGQVTADKIIKYREENGKFEKIEDLLLVDGLGEKTVEGFKEEIIF